MILTLFITLLIVSIGLYLRRCFQTTDHLMQEEDMT
jgi:hypothetical protein